MHCDHLGEFSSKGKQEVSNGRGSLQHRLIQYFLVVSSSYAICNWDQLAFCVNKTFEWCHTLSIPYASFSLMCAWMKWASLIMPLYLWSLEFFVKWTQWDIYDHHAAILPLPKLQAPVFMRFFFFLGTKRGGRRVQ